MKIILAILFLLLVTSLNAQTDKIVVELDTIYSGLDSYYINKRNELEQKGYLRTSQGGWLNELGEEVYVAVPAHASPHDGRRGFLNRVTRVFQHYDNGKGYGSVIFAVSKKGELSDFYCVSVGDTSINNSLLKILEREPVWSGRIWSGPLVDAVYKLTVFTQ